MNWWMIPLIVYLALLAIGLVRELRHPYRYKRRP